MVADLSQPNKRLKRTAEKRGRLAAGRYIKQHIVVIFSAPPFVMS